MVEEDNIVVYHTLENSRVYHKEDLQSIEFALEVSLTCFSEIMMPILNELCADLFSDMLEYFSKSAMSSSWFYSLGRSTELLQRHVCGIDTL